MTQDDHKEYYEREILGPFREKKYGETLGKLRPYITREGLPVKDYMRARKVISSCLIAISKDGMASEQAKEYSAHLEKYLEELGAVDKKDIAPVPCRDYFGDVIEYCLLTRGVTEIGTLVSAYLKRFVEKTGAKVSLQEYFATWISKVDDERRNFARPDHTRSAIALAEALVHETESREDLKKIRIEANKILADMVYFFHSSDITDAVREKNALMYLDAVLQEDPTDTSSHEFKNHITKLAGTNLQIRRFYHDTNVRMGSINTKCATILRSCTPTMSIYSDMVDLTKQCKTLQAVSRLVAGKQLQEEEQEIIDIANLITPLLSIRNFSRDCILLKGERQPWGLSPELITLVFDNLLLNTFEAYIRTNNIKKTDKPCSITIDYVNRTVLYRDYAGGIDPSLGDVFEPYKSSKGVYSNVGLGMTQVRSAMEIQGFSIELASPQPEDGVLFMLNFKKNKRSTL